MKHHRVRVNLTKSQLNKIHQALQHKTGVKLRLSQHNLHASSPTVLLLTDIQIEKLKDGYVHDITIPYKRLHQMHVGGFLPLLLPLLAGLASTAGIAGGVATAVKSSKEAQLADARRAALGRGCKCFFK